MSAIDKDRELAAQATQGEWSADMAKSHRDCYHGSAPITAMVASRDIYRKGAKAGQNKPDICVGVISLEPDGACGDEDCCSQGDHIDFNQEDAEHIVRLHNRQPLYDALVDAVIREFGRPFCLNTMAYRSSIATTDPFPCGKCPACAVNALDQEDQG